MRGPRRHTVLSFWIDLLSCFVLPVYTLRFAGNSPWFDSNFSVLAAVGIHAYRSFFRWGLLSAVSYLLILGGISRTLHRTWQQMLLCTLVLLGCGALVWSLIIPYLPREFPKYADLHVLLAFAACVFLMAAILAALLCCRQENPFAFRSLLLGWWAIIAVSGMLFLHAGIISTALEVFFTLSTLFLTRRLFGLRQPT